MPTLHPILRRGTPVVLSAPSGTGKTTLCRQLMQRLPDLAFSVSHTTRPPRGNERPGVDYHFVDDAHFDRLIAGGHFLEWAPVHRRRYGTSRAATESLLEQGRDVLFDIDVQGGRQIAASLPEAVLVLVLPPSLQVAATEIRAATFYTHVIVNESLEDALAALQSILTAERARLRNHPHLIDRVLLERAANRP